MPQKVVLAVVDGMTPAAFERAVESGRAPALAFLAEHGDYRQATSVFPSLTPVCLTSIATGAGPGVHHIPSLVWWNRQERRIVEYGSSFAALRKAGFSRGLLDTILNMNARHLSPDAVTIYEALEGAGLVSGAVNITCYRGRHRYLPTVPGTGRAAYGPRRFFFYGLFESDRTGAPFAVRSRRTGSVDAYAAAVGRWLVTRDGFDFLAYYLSGYDFASHAAGPDGAAADHALEQADAAIGALLDAAGGPDEFLERYAVVLLSDHGQTKVEQVGASGGAVRGSRGRGAGDGVEPGRAGLPAAGRARGRGRARPAPGRLPGGGRHAPPRRRRGRRPARRRGRPGRAAGASRRRLARPLGALEPERRRAARVRGGGLGARRPRRAPSRGRRQPRLTRRRGLVRRRL